MALFGFGKKQSAGEAAAQPARNATLSDGRSVVIKQVVDCIGSSCPRPQLATKKALGNLVPGDVIEVRVDNPTSMEAIPPLLAGLHSTHLETVKAERYWQIFCRKD